MSADDDGGLTQGQIKFQPLVAQVFITRANDSGGLHSNHTTITYANGTKIEWAMLSNIPEGHYKVFTKNFNSRYPFSVQVNGKTSDFVSLGHNTPTLTYMCGREEKICNSYDSSTFRYMYATYDSTRRNSVTSISCPTLKCDLQCTDTSPCMIIFEQTEITV